MSDFAKFSSQVNDLMHCIQLQEQAAFAELYSLTSGKLLGLIQRILEDRQEAEDCLQDVFIKLWHNARQYTNKGSAWGWLCMVARNAALDKVRQRTSRQNKESDLKHSEMFEDMFENADVLQQQSIKRCLSKLKASPRQAIMLSYIHGYSHHEITQNMSAPLGTVKAWIRRGLQELKQCLTA